MVLAERARGEGARETWEWGVGAGDLWGDTFSFGRRCDRRDQEEGQDKSESKNQITSYDIGPARRKKRFDVDLLPSQCYYEPFSKIILFTVSTIQFYFF